MMAAIAWGLATAALFVASLFTFLQERDLWRQRREGRGMYEALKTGRPEFFEISRADALERGYQAAMEIQPLPDHQIVAWTPEEREAFGHNETIAWIAATDRILNQLDWDRRRAQMIPPTTSVMTKEDDQVVVAHVYAWGEEKPVRSITTPTRRTTA